MAFEGQNAFGMREHTIRTLQFEYGDRGHRGRNSDMNVIGVMERRGDLTKPMMGLIKNTSNKPFTFYIEESADAAVAFDSVYAHAKGHLILTAAVDGSTVALGDGTNTIIFEFDDNGAVGGGNVAVPLTPNAADPVYDALQALVKAVAAQAALGNIGLHAEDITQFGSYGAATQPDREAIFTHTVKGVASGVTAVLAAGAVGTYTATAAPAPLTTRVWNAQGVAVTGTEFTVSAGAAVQFMLEGATEKWLRFSLEPNGFSLTNPKGAGVPEAFLELGYYFGLMEPYEMSQGNAIMRLPN